MGMANSATQYGSVAKFFHWLIFLLVFVMIIGGFCLGFVPEDYKATIYNLHKLTGLTILLLMLLRLAWSLINVKPELPPRTPVWQRLAERTVHGFLYLLVIAMPLAGWIGSSAAGKYPHIGDWKLALPVPQTKPVISTAFDFHELIAYGIIVFVSIHFLAAMYHHFIKRDDILRRMWF